jgi:hypothetical protein
MNPRRPGLTPRCWPWAWLLAGCLLATGGAMVAAARSSPQPGPSASDPCHARLGQPATPLRQILEARLRQGLPSAAQLAEGHARLAPLSVLVVDCQGQRLVASGAYEFRGNIGVMDVTRRGTVVLQWQLRALAERRQVVLESPQVLDLTFANPAPWFDGKAIRTWVLDLFAAPLCASVPGGQPC